MVFGRKGDNVLMKLRIKCARRDYEIFGCDKEVGKYLYIRLNKSKEELLYPLFGYKKSGLYKKVRLDDIA